MTLYRGGSEIGKRTLFVQQIEQPAGAYDLGLVILEAPSALAGTELLSWSDDAGDERQWLTLGGSDRSRRIGDRGRRASFVNSDYTFEDLLRWQVNSYHYEMVGPSDCPSGRCVRVRAEPTSRSSAYDTLLVDYDGEDRVRQVQYFQGGEGAAWKTQVIEAYQRVAGTWQPTRMTMTDHRAGTRTQVRWSDYKANQSLDTGQFRAK